MQFNIALLLLLPTFFYGGRTCAQAYNPTGTKLDESRLTLFPETIVVDDATADGGKAIFRPANAAVNTMWFGPYAQFQAGNYLVQFRMKVTSNVSNNALLQLDVIPTGGAYQPLWVRADMFRASNQWELITIPITLTNTVSNVEVRGISFRPGTTDVYLDYINIIPGDARGFYTGEYTVTNKGDVGIGTVTPATKLHVIGKSKIEGDMDVVGNIKTKKVKVTVSDWPDYVFEPGYKMTALSELEQYIQQHKHLPDVIPAAVANKEGIDVSDTQAVLLKKIEELTRYIIDQDKRINAQNKRIEELEAKVTPTSPLLPIPPPPSHHNP
ncbi:hypothetical protein HHL17_03605 [Chitinophaga sp. G-6-1-13]|uniref:CBM-cenC domain-containing protein n=1 Tax=Chitinophaga fulva TaxID=2728842 RepID=A0A848GE37_9BACT|nr:hypothetical protein [Chitinophaga fulva]NML36276.1 hypothetical protein [Chitinophaga fulva]